VSLVGRGDAAQDLATDKAQKLLAEGRLLASLKASDRRYLMGQTSCNANPGAPHQHGINHRTRRVSNR